MSLNKRVSVALTAVLLLAGCVNSPSSPVFKQLSEGVPRQNVGWVMFSLTKTGPYLRYCGIWPTLYLRSFLSGIDSSVTVERRKLRSDTPRIPIPVPGDLVLERGDPLGSIVLIELPAGQYEFYKYWAYAENAGLLMSASTIVQSAPSFRYTFQVVPGKLNYLGDLNFVFSPSGVQFQVNDERYRDMGLFAAQLPAYRGKTTTFFAKP